MEDPRTDEVPPAEDAAPELPDPRAHGAPTSRSGGRLVIHPRRDGYLGLVRALAGDGYGMCVDLCGVDYLLHSDRPLPDGVDRERFEVVVNLLSMGDRDRVRVRVPVPAEDPWVPSLFELHPGTEAMEREAFDMMGVVFADHPDLTRILMPDDWEGHPLRKDYAVGRVPVQFKHPLSAR